MPTSRRRERGIQQARSHILDAASEVFANNGYSEVTIQEIAEAAEYSVPTIYAYFKGKQAILDALSESLIASLHDLYDLVLPEGLTLRQRFELLLRHQFSWVERRRSLILVLFRHGQPPSCGDGGRGGDPLAMFDELAKWLDAHVTDEELDGRSRELAALALWSLTHAFVLRWLRDGGSASLQAQARDLLDFYFTGLSGGRTRPTEGGGS
jgi:AcrR family transcriptional regulator